jgi:hypothetical protein
MASGNIIIFGDSAIDTGFVVKLVGPSYLQRFKPSRGVFKTNFYRATVSNQRYWLHHTAGIPSSRTGRSSFPMSAVLRNLYYFISPLGSINLLIYVVCADKPTSDNFRFFYDYLCQQDAPIILVQTTHTPSEVSWFNLVLTLDGADPESDKVNLHKAITKHLNRNPKFISDTDRLESAARGCWTLLGKEASWTLADFRDALKLTLRNEASLTEKDGDAICERIVEDFQMSLNKQSAKNEIQRRVDAILSTIIAVGNATPIPFLSVATESIENIGETVQVCATAIDLRS